MATQLDISPASNPTLGIHFHAPNGVSASVISAAAGGSNPTDAPSVLQTASPNSANKTVSVTVAASIAPVRFCNPS